MEERKIEVSFASMLDALMKAYKKEPLMNLLKKEPAFILLFPVVLGEVWNELTSEHTEEE